MTGKTSTGRTIAAGDDGSTPAASALHWAAMAATWTGVVNVVPDPADPQRSPQD